MYHTQQQKYIQVFKKEEGTGKIKLIAEFDDIWHLVSYNGREFFNFSSDFEDRYNYSEDNWVYTGRVFRDYEKQSQYCCLAFDQDGTHYSKERLIGFRRTWAQSRINWWNRPRHFRSKAFGKHRTVRTFHEHKWAHAWNDEEFAPKCRARRQGNYLPTYWDDYITHNDKSWKTQSKRKHQWKIQVD